MKKENNKFPLSLIIYVITLTAVNAVLYTPALPELTKQMGITQGEAQYTIAFFLIGYALAQIVFGITANFFGRKKSLLIGLNLGVAASLLCVISILLKNYQMLLFGRFLVGLGTASGLIISYAVVNDTYTGVKARKVTSYLVMAFAIAPGIANLIGGFLTALNPIFCFIFLFLYNMTALILVFKESNIKEENNHLDLKKYFIDYWRTAKNFNVISPAFIYGCFAAILYAIVAIAPFIAIQNMKLSATSFGILFCITYSGYLLGSCTNTALAHRITPHKAIIFGIFTAFTGEAMMLILNFTDKLNPATFFSCIFIMMFSMPFVFVNASVISISGHHHKSNASSVLNTINITTACLVIFICGHIRNHYYVSLIEILIALTLTAFAVFIITAPSRATANKGIKDCYSCKN